MPVVNIDYEPAGGGEDHFCWGWINGTLYLGDTHHALIISQLIDTGIFTWETLMAAKQLWGWTTISDSSYSYYGDNDVAPSYEYEGEINLATDDAKQSYGIKTQVKNAFKEAFPYVKSWSMDKGKGYSSQQNYGERARKQYLNQDDDNDSV